MGDKEKTVEEKVEKGERVDSARGRVPKMGLARSRAASSVVIQKNRVDEAERKRDGGGAKKKE